MRTEIGAFERDNPFLSISIPKRFRATKFGILETLNFDSKQLQTHFDVRATLLDILKVFYYWFAAVNFSSSHIFSFNQRLNSWIVNRKIFLMKKDIR